MLFYTVTDKKEGALALPKNVFVIKEEYGSADAQAFLSYAKAFYIRIDTESDTTDFNDRYHDSWTRIVPCNAENLLIKDGIPFGFIAYGLAKFESPYIVLTEDAPKAWDGENSGYSSLDRDFRLCRYEKSEAVTDVASRYRLIMQAKEYKLKDGRIMKKTEEVSERITYFTAFDVVEDEGSFLLQTDKITFRVPEEENEVKEMHEDFRLGARDYRTYRTFRLEKIWES